LFLHKFVGLIDFT